MTPAGATEKKCSDLTGDEEQEVFRIRRSKSSDNTGPRWGEFLIGRKLVVLNNALKEPLPAGNRPVEQLKPDGPNVGVDTAGPSAKKEALALQTAQEIRKFILQYKNSLAREWPREMVSFECNGFADCNDNMFPQSKLAGDYVDVRRSIIAYNLRFKNPSWAALYKHVLEYLPILWYVVKPEEVLRECAMPACAKDERFYTKEIRKHLIDLVHLPTFKKHLPKSWTLHETNELAKSIMDFLPIAVKSLGGHESGTEQGM